MTREASKTNKLRGAEFNKQFLSGRIVDIGAGNDLVVPYAEKFDIADGDAQVITRYLPKNSYDAVHSSHCLEHMADPVMALEEW
ncbi:MAG: methyltransferase domain-containing protein [Chitinophagia bacterium]|nr:methyltransferase domain-containing protein [Chitinophagia bacterium]